MINLYFSKASDCDFAKMTMFVLSRSTEPHRLTTTMYCYLLLSLLEGAAFNFYTSTITFDLTKHEEQKRY